MRATLVATVLAAGVLASPMAAYAQTTQPYVSVTNCEQVQVNEQGAVRLTLSFFGKSGGWYGMAVLPPGGPNYPDTCSVLEGSAPPGWTVYRQADGNLYFHSPDFIPANVLVGGFQVTLNKGTCCKGFGFIQATLLDNPGTQVCFADCLAVPAEQLSWGRMKAIYR
ncbi:MAG: hypothetical protein ABI960_10885 [Candidatus Eisenbacteria bacterium]